MWGERWDIDACLSKIVKLVNLGKRNANIPFAPSHSYDLPIPGVARFCSIQTRTASCCERGLGRVCPWPVGVQFPFPYDYRVGIRKRKLPYRLLCTCCWHGQNTGSEAAQGLMANAYSHGLTQPLLGAVLASYTQTTALSSLILPCLTQLPLP